MFPIQELDAILSETVQINHLFELYRLVDPISHSVYDLKDGTLIRYPEKCYATWKRKKPCDNCVSRHTCLEQCVHFKLEYMENVVYLIVSVPVTLEGKPYSLELGKNVTDSMLVGEDHKTDNSDLISVIQSFNTMAVTDAFTGLYNKGHMLNQLSSFMTGEMPDVTTLVGVLMDLDHFKLVNDRYGHFMGDVVLKAFADRLKQETDGKAIWAGRMGGDEFAIFFADKTVQEAESRCRAMIADIEQRPFYKDGVSFHIGVSIGAEQVDRADTIEAYVDKLDKKMYKEKAEKAEKARRGKK
ncbi:MAG: GGDEF domain-containing protein [Clostridia bacterium]